MGRRLGAAAPLRFAALTCAEPLPPNERAGAWLPPVSLIKSIFWSRQRGPPQGDDKVSMAGETMMAQPSAMQTLFQELVARHIAVKKIGMMKKADPKMMTPAGQEMKSMLMDDGALMGAKQEMIFNENSAMMMAREELIHSLMLDKEIMALVEKESMMHEDPKMAPMMSDEKMEMEGEAMVKDKGKAMALMQETMVRKMIDGKQKMMKDDSKGKK